jgi:hypothetical protein
LILHTTFLAHRWSSQFQVVRRKSAWLGERRTLTIAFPQDEYDHAEVLEDWLEELAVDVVLSNFSESQWEVLYPRLHGRVVFEHVLTGYLDDATVSYGHDVPCHGTRPFDIVYRATRLPPSFGSHGQLKHLVGEAAQAAAADRNLRADISTNPADTIIGRRWQDFLASGRAVVGAESGSSALDRRGELAVQIRELTQADPTLTFEQLSARLPTGWDDYRFFALSPRHLEAAATRTLQILVEGRYDGVLEPDRHYVPVRRDLSNLGEALERVGDVQFVQRVTEQAFSDVCLSGVYSYRALADRLVAFMHDAPIQRRSRRSVAAWRSAPLLARATSELSTVQHRLGPLRTSGAGRTLAVGRATATNATLRALVLQYMRDSDVRRATTPSQLAADVLRLHALGRALASGVVSASVVSPERGTLVIETTDGGKQGDVSHLGGNEGWRLNWHHLGRPIELDLPTGGGLTAKVSIPSPYLYSFDAVNALSSRTPSLPRRVLEMLFKTSS